MGKVSSKDGEAKTPKQKRRLSRSNNKYLKPGALAQYCYSKASSVKSCTDLVNTRVNIKGEGKRVKSSDAVMESRVVASSPVMLSPVNLLEQNSLVRTPQTPRFEEVEYESRLEGLPMDVLVKLLCHLHHDQLRPVFHVSQKIRKAVILARQYHFNFTTPDRSRQEMLSIMTPRPNERWPFVSRANRNGISAPSPHTPKAPKHGPRPPSRIKIREMRQIAAVLFQDSALSSKCRVPSVITRPLCKSLASNRVLFYEDELCQAVAQNKLL